MTERVVRVSLIAQVNNYLSGAEQARKATVKLAEASEDASAKYERQNQAMTDVGVRLTAFGAVATVATGLAIKAAIDWESAWTGVTKTVNGSATEMAALEDQLRSLTGVLPATHEEIAGVAEAAGQLGVAREDVAAFTKTMIDLSETTNLTADEAATSIAQLMNVMQTAPEDVDNLGAALVALGNDGASTERDIVQMAQRIAGAGRIVGLTEAQVLGFANAFASVGIDAEAGGSAVSRIMTDIAMAVSAGGEELDKFAVVAGTSSKDFQKAFKDDPADAIASFVEGLARIDKQGGDVFKTLSDLGQSDIRVSNALLGMANSGDLLRKSLELGSKAWKENTALLQEAEKRYGTTEAKIQIASNSIKDAAIDWGSVFLPAVSAVAEVVADAAQAFAALPEPVQAGAVGAVTLAAGVALAGGAFLIGVPRIAAFNAQLAILRASEMPGVARAATLASGAVGGMTKGLTGAAAFLTGPWGVALVAAAVGVTALTQVVDRMRSTTEQMENSARLATDANEILATAFKGAPDGFWWDDGARSLENFQHRLDLLSKMDANLWEKLLPGNQAETTDFAIGLDKVGKSLASIAADDMPAAMRAFELLRAKTDGSDQQLRQLLKSMGPEFEAVLVRRATDLGFVTEGLSDTERAQVLLNVATKEAAPAADSAAQAYKQAASEAQTLTDGITSLIEAVNAANGLGQDAVSTNARYQASLAGISTEVDRQKEAFIQLQRDAYETANGTLDGFVETLDGFSLSLDESTAAGSSNAAMLADVAKAAEDSARAQLELDAATVGVDAATDNYLTTQAAQRQAFIDSATEAGFSAEAVQLLADKVFALPPEREVRIIAETAAASSDLNRFIADASQRVISLGIRTYYKDGPQGQVRIDFGGGVEGYAEGGLLPGRPSRKDNMLIRAASGEFITRANQAAIPENRAALEYMNAGGVIRGYANGGTVQPEYMSSMPRYNTPSSSRPAARQQPMVRIDSVSTLDVGELARALTTEQGRALAVSGGLYGEGD